MLKRIYVGNLSSSAVDNQIQALFEQYGNVASVNLATDRDTGRPRGFGYVEMEEKNAEAAIEALDGVLYNGRNLKVYEAYARGGGPGGGRGRRW